MKRLITSLATIVVLTGCATQYQSSGFTGGHLDQQGPGKLHMVVFSANGYTAPELAQKYALYRCAEVAQSLHKPFFTMFDSLTSAALERPSSIPRIGIVQNKPTATAFILPLDAPRAGVHDTQATLDDLRDLITTGQLTQPDTVKNQ
jgi:hypothetical protein